MCFLCNFCEDSVFFVIFIVRFFISLFYGLFLGFLKISLHSLQNNKVGFILFRSFVTIFEINLEDSLHSLQNNKASFIFISLVCYYLCKGLRSCIN